ncbi:MAG: hypothetical protein QXL77_03120 [Candidatus Bathyarchaeia archaeon]
MRVIETILASLVIMVALSFVNNTLIPPYSPRYEATELEKLGYNVLHNLEARGILTRYVYDSDIARGQALLRSALMVSLTPDIYFNLTIYRLDEFGQLHLEGQPIIHGEPEAFQNPSQVSTVTYILASPGDYYDPRILVLQLVRR